MKNEPAVKIFYADDDVDDRFLFEEALRQVNAAVELQCFTGGRQLEKKLLEQDYDCDLVFLDLNMPGWNGLQTLQSLQPAIMANRIKVIIFTTSADEKVIRETYNLQAVLFVQKPGDFNLLISMLQDIINKKNSLTLPVAFKDFEFKHGYA